MKIYLLIKCYEDGDSYQTFSDLEEAKEVFEGEKKDACYRWYHALALCEIGPNQRFGFSDYGFDGEGVNVIAEWSKDYPA